VLDGIDRLTAAERDQLAAKLRDAGESVAVFATASDPAPALALLADAGRPASVIDLSEAPEDSTMNDSSESTEVNA
jgi:RND superfamily putative drug exporter